MTSSQPPVPDLFTAYISRTLLAEGQGAYTNDPNDRGGETKWGITEARARAAGYTGDMRDLSRDEALRIYRLFYWEQPGFDKIAQLCKPLAAAMLDLGVNCGTSQPVLWLQRALNVLNCASRLYPNIPMDGQAGAVTRAALAGYLGVRGAEGARVLVAVIRALAGTHYIEIAEHDATQEQYEYGWLSQRAFPSGTDLALT